MRLKFEFGRPLLKTRKTENNLVGIYKLMKFSIVTILNLKM